jgi:hypothetical protein
MSAAHLRLVECRAILGGARDPLRAVWDERATRKDRRLLLAMAGVGVAESARRSGSSWCDLPPAMRGDISRGLGRFRDWAARVVA